ncbi:MAG: protein-glutamate O-methyltransferase CheR [Fibrobacter sp.]|nr:protein-glutamate O-methyltransferase CheR [Fibrobacter sp.]
MALKSISDTEYAEFVQLVYDLTGIILDNSKKYLIETRIGPIIQEQGLGSYGELLQKIRLPTNAFFKELVIDAITTNETFFFREPCAIDLLRRRLMPPILDSITEGKRRDSMRIWSAACSSGQEMYSIAISAMEFIGDLATQYISLDGTDISEQILAKASMGVYSQFEVNRGLNATHLSKYFTPHSQGYKINDNIRAMCRFNKANLLRLAPSPVRYDVIFCRNVSIYFGAKEREVLFRSLGERLVPNGVLIVGATEQVRDCDDLYSLEKDFPGCFYYRRRH